MGSFQRTWKHLLVLQLHLQHLQPNPKSTHYKHRTHFSIPSKYFQQQHLSSAKRIWRLFYFPGFFVPPIYPPPTNWGIFSRCFGEYSIDKLGNIRPLHQFKTVGQYSCRFLVRQHSRIMASVLLALFLRVANISRAPPTNPLSVSYLVIVGNL